MSLLSATDRFETYYHANNMRNDRTGMQATERLFPGAFCGE